ncbi:MAG: Smr/MutS family protein [Betaproteobacteria bacterium]|nr:Smr/MutS family protein [Betaproteobacteria bacterium]
MKQFSELAALREQLARQARAEAEAREARRREQARLAREAAVFREAVADAVPLKPAPRVVPAREPVAPRPLQREADERLALAQSMSDEIDIERLLDTDENLSYRREGVGADVVRRLRRGQWTVQGQIDLHGKRVDEARLALAEFLAQALREQRRCLRVIHGKGLGSVAREPVLKGKVLRWLVQRDEVLAFCQARPNDGGAGALLVLLRGG